MYTIDNGICHWKQEDGRIDIYDKDDITKLIIETDFTEIPAKHFNKMKQLREVVLPASATSIAPQAFANCSKLRVINLENIKKIGDQAFFGTSIVHLDLSNVEELGKDCFAGNYYVQDIKINVDIPEYCFQKAHDLERVEIGDNVKIIGQYAFADCSSLTEIIIGSGVTTIESGAFSNTGLVDLDLANITEIGEKSFNGCKQLKTLKINCNIPIGCFGGAESLETVELGSNVDTIKTYGFASCPNLKKINLSNIKNFGSYAFYNSGLTRIELDNISVIEHHCFSGSKIESVKINHSVPENCFLACEYLKTVEIGSAAKVIEKDAFTNCTNLQQVKILPGLTKISTEAFKNCKSLVKITFPPTLALVDDYAFGGATRLTELNFNPNVKFGVYPFGLDDWDHKLLFNVDDKQIKISGLDNQTINNLKNQYKNYLKYYIFSKFVSIFED